LVTREGACWVPPPAVDGWDDPAVMIPPAPSEFCGVIVPVGCEPAGEDEPPAPGPAPPEDPVDPDGADGDPLDDPGRTRIAPRTQVLASSAVHEEPSRQTRLPMQAPLLAPVDPEPDPEPADGGVLVVWPTQVFRRVARQPPPTWTRLQLSRQRPDVGAGVGVGEPVELPETGPPLPVQTRPSRQLPVEPDTDDPGLDELDCEEVEVVEVLVVEVVDVFALVEVLVLVVDVEPRQTMKHPVSGANARGRVWWRTGAGAGGGGAGG
jgi:hypothetical protein